MDLEDFLVAIIQIVVSLAFLAVPVGILIVVLHFIAKYW